MASTTTRPEVAPTEVSPKASRRTFTAEYKQRILREAEACTGPGEMAALLRREGLYSSHLSVWRRRHTQGSAFALAPKKRGPKARPMDKKDKQILELKREKAKLQVELDRAQLMIELQKKLSEILGIRVPEEGEEL